jgi:hypothetical protein
VVGQFVGRETREFFHRGREFNSLISSASLLE